MLRREDGLPALRTLLPTVALSSGKNWKAYSKELQDALAPLVKPSKQIREHARGVLTVPEFVYAFWRAKMHPDDRKKIPRHLPREEKIKALRNDVLKNIRLAGPSFTELPLSTLSPPEKTLARGYGHALDRMILLDAMLRAEGFRTEIIFAESRKSPEGESAWSFHGIPQRNEFTQPLLAVLPERSFFGSTKSDKIYLGDGDQYTPLGATAFDGFHALNPATANIGRISVATEFKAQTRSETVIDLQPNGDAIITYTNWHYGASCAVFRKKYVEQPPEERRREHLELINEFSRGAEPLSPLVTETDAYPGYMAFSLRAPRYAALGENTMTVLLPPPPGLPLPLRSDRRYNPIQAPEIFKDEKTVRVILPEGFEKRVVAPSALDFGSNVSHSMFGNGREIHFTSQVKMYDELIQAREYPMLLEANRKLTHPSQRTLILTREE
jgi:hypothetical protein